MSAPVHVERADDERLSDFAGLRYPERRMHLEVSGGFYVGEGTLVVERMISLGAPIRAVATTPAVHERHRDALDRVDAPVYVLERAMLNELVGFDLHRGIVASATRPMIPDATEVLADPQVRTVLALEGLNDFENLGSIMRSAAALGADAVLLIAEILPGEELKTLLRQASSLGLHVLVELHDAEQLDRVVDAGAVLIGINNRDLRTFKTSLEHTLDLLSVVPKNSVVVSESGIKTNADLRRLEAAGVKAVLVGESLMRSPDIGAALDELRGDPIK